MGKKRKGTKRKGKSAGYKPKSVEEGSQPKKKSRYPLIGLVVGVALLVFGGYFFYQREEPKQPAHERANLKKENIRLRETRQTLSPQRFKGKARKTYEIARAIPEVLDRLYCYCRCKENFNHKNLLSCYVDTHAST